MPYRPSVVGKPQRLNKATLHAVLMQGWSRAIAACGGRAAFAERMEISGEALRQQTNGSFPSFEIIDRAVDVEPSVLEEWLATKNLKVVDRNAIGSTDDALVTVTQLAAKIAEAVHPDGPGGRAIVHSEYLGLEDLMREMHRLSGSWLEECASIRGLRVVK